jgi:hypothetical protein
MNTTRALARLFIHQLTSPAFRTAFSPHAGQTRALMVGAGLHEVRSLYFLLLPSAAPLARRIDHGSWRIPLGAQNVASGIA